MVFRVVIGFLLPIFWASFCFAQQEDEGLEELLSEQLGEDLGEHTDLSELTEGLSYYRRNPINLNTATAQELSSLFFLTAQQIENLLLHRKQSGNFISLLELQGVPGFDLQTIQHVQPYITVGIASSLRGLTINNLLSDGEHSLLIRMGRILEKQRGYGIEDEDRSRYLGTPYRYAIRYRMSYENKVSLAINAEKDAGEPFFAHKQRLGFDFYTGHIAFNRVSKSIGQVVVGDYALQFGQGLIAWNGLSFGKGAWIGSVTRQGVGVRPYSSMNENNFQRGIATTISYKDIAFIPFMGYNNLSGNMMSVEGEPFIRTINYSGLHRTPTEQSYRHAIKQFVYGVNTTYRVKRLKAGLTYMSTNFNGTVLRGTNLYQQYNFEGSSLNQVGLHYNYTFRNYYFFGETAHSFSGGWATNNGLIASLHPKVSVFVNQRSYQRNYYSFYAQSLSEGTSVSNEKGMYSGLVYHPNRKVEFLGFIDVFRFPWLRYRVDAPSAGTDFLTQFSYTWYKKGHVLIRYRHRLRQENLALANRSENLLADVVRHQLRLDVQYKLSNYWSVRTRLEGVHYAKELEEQRNGILVYQDVLWKLANSKLQGNVRLAYFDTDGYNARIYAYENDVLYASSFPMYYDKGVRTYLNLRWRMRRNIDLWGRYAITRYRDREEVGSGLDLIKGNKRSDFRIQLRWQW